MTENTSLFARRLRDWRSATGTHGRLTQEQLAERLGVSADAVGKYERSLSFIRGDLEHRLTERLGWSRADVIACREDWRSRSGTGGRAGYRLLDSDALEEVFGGSLEAAVSAMFRLVGDCLAELPPDLEANPTVFTGNCLAFPEHWGLVLCGDAAVAKWSLPFLLPADEALFRQGRLLESTLTADRLRRPFLPGLYYGYCPALIVAPGHEAASHLLLQSFTTFLETLARRDVLLDGIGTISVSDAGAQVCRDLGMTRLCDHVLDSAFGCWDLPGADLPRTIFARRSPLLRRAYTEAFPARATRNASSRS